VGGTVSHQAKKGKALFKARRWWVERDKRKKGAGGKGQRTLRKKEAMTMPGFGGKLQV